MKAIRDLKLIETWVEGALVVEARFAQGSWGTTDEGERLKSCAATGIGEISRIERPLGQLDLISWCGR